MKCRQVSFHAERSATASVMATIADEVIPKFSAIPHFLGYVVLESETAPGHGALDERREMTVMSFWHTGLEGSEEVAQEFISEINRVAGTNPTRRSYNLMKAMWRGRDGDELMPLP